MRAAESVSSAVLLSWTADPWLLSGLLLCSVVYSVGWLRLRRRVPGRFGPGQALAFQSGLFLLAIAVCSPLDAFGSLFLSVHMTQHLLLMMVVPPLLWWGAPVLPLMHGLPTALLRDGLGPFLAWPALQRFAAFLGRPLVCWLAFLASTWIWHVPVLYELALRSPFWHGAEHAFFLATGLMFWWPVVRPWPSRRASSPWIVVLYLISADLANTVFSAIFTFADEVIYPSYALAPQWGGGTALEDQVRAGVIMWVPGSILFLAPLSVLIVRALDGAGERARAEARRRRVMSLGAGVLGAAGFDATAPRLIRLTPGRLDLTRVRFLRLAGSRRARTVAQTLSSLIALVIVLDGFLGPDLSPLNLAGVLPWTWVRALMVFGLAMFGAVLCWACPFTAARRLAERVLGGRREWPRRLRNKWIAVGLVVLFLWAYEAWALWDRPAWTAALVLGYFIAAFVVDGLFRGAAFCKWLCPLGQFQFVCSTVSPFEVAVRDASSCGSCSTHDCLVGNADQPGCSLDLFLPEKSSSLDCTFCMDCVAACPHDNAGVLFRPPGSTLLVDPARSSIGRLSQRTDLAVLALVFVWGGSLNAAAMVAPVQALLQDAANALGWPLSPAGLAGLGILAALAALLALTAGVARFAGVPVDDSASGTGAGTGTGTATATVSATSTSPATRRATRISFCRLAWALVPLGVTMWLAHFAMHFVGGWTAIIPSTQRVLQSLGVAAVSEGGASASMAHAMVLPGSLLTLQVLALDVGLLASLYLGWRVLRRREDGVGRNVVHALPFTLLAAVLWAFDVWVLFQPMQMRGTMGMG